MKKIFVLMLSVFLFSFTFANITIDTDSIFQRLENRYDLDNSNTRDNLIKVFGILQKTDKPNFVKRILLVLLEKLENYQPKHDPETTLTETGQNEIIQTGDNEDLQDKRTFDIDLSLISSSKISFEYTGTISSKLDCDLQEIYFASTGSYTGKIWSEVSFGDKKLDTFLDLSEDNVLYFRNINEKVFTPNNNSGAVGKYFFSIRGYYDYDFSGGVSFVPDTVVCGDDKYKAGGDNIDLSISGTKLNISNTSINHKQFGSDGKYILGRLRFDSYRLTKLSNIHVGFSKINSAISKVGIMDEFGDVLDTRSVSSQTSFSRDLDRDIYGDANLYFYIETSDQTSTLTNNLNYITDVSVSVSVIELYQDGKKMDLTRISDIVDYDDFVSKFDVLPVSFSNIFVTKSLDGYPQINTVENATKQTVGYLVFDLNNTSKNLDLILKKISNLSVNGANNIQIVRDNYNTNIPLSSIATFDNQNKGDLTMSSDMQNRVVYKIIGDVGSSSNVGVSLNTNGIKFSICKDGVCLNDLTAKGLGTSDFMLVN